MQKIKTSRTHFMRMRAASTKGKTQSETETQTQTQTEPGCTRAQRDNNEKQFTKSTQRLDQKQRRSRTARGTKGEGAGDAAAMGAGGAGRGSGRSGCYTTQNTSLSIKFLKWNFKSLKQKRRQGIRNAFALFGSVARW